MVCMLGITSPPTTRQQRLSLQKPLCINVTSLSYVPPSAHNGRETRRVLSEFAMKTPTVNARKVYGRNRIRLRWGSLHAAGGEVDTDEEAPHFPKGNRRRHADVGGIGTSNSSEHAYMQRKWVVYARAQGISEPKSALLAEEVQGKSRLQRKFGITVPHQINSDIALNELKVFESRVRLPFFAAIERQGLGFEARRGDVRVAECLHDRRLAPESERNAFEGCTQPQAKGGAFKQPVKMDDWVLLPRTDSEIGGDTSKYEKDQSTRTTQKLWAVREHVIGQMFKEPIAGKQDHLSPLLVFQKVTSKSQMYGRKEGRKITYTARSRLGKAGQPRSFDPRRLPDWVVGLPYHIKNSQRDHMSRESSRLHNSVVTWSKLQPRPGFLIVPPHCQKRLAGTSPSAPQGVELQLTDQFGIMEANDSAGVSYTSSSLFLSMAFRS
ncbi:hypothetical protein K438DRAFT_1781233 [Mycena galopus ATCC 62051]|nr:hypothetical protein K438DRAFT_1781233 [Mycena galopus ATCC 62051]